MLQILTHTLPERIRQAFVAANAVMIFCLAIIAGLTGAQAQQSGTIPVAVQGKWYVAYIADLKSIPDKPTTIIYSKPTMKFGADGRVDGNGGCNHYFGKATMDAAAIKFSGFRMTRKHCAGDGSKLEHKFIDAKIRARKYTLKPGEMDLLNADGKIIMRLVRKP